MWVDDGRMSSAHRREESGMGEEWYQYRSVFFCCPIRLCKDCKEDGTGRISVALTATQDIRGALECHSASE